MMRGEASDNSPIQVSSGKAPEAPVLLTRPREVVEVNADILDKLNESLQDLRINHARRGGPRPPAPKVEAEREFRLHLVLQC